MRTALVLGSTGLVGSHLLKRLLEDSNYSHVTALVRKPTGLTNAKLKEQVVDFDRLETAAEAFKVDDVFCTLGTTIKKVGNDQRKFFEVDFGYPAKAAKIAKRVGAKKFLVVTSVGANPASLNFYLKTKGQLESELKLQEFNELHFFRPSFLMGQRQEARTGERIATAASSALRFLFQGPLKKYRPVMADDVAHAMIEAAKKSNPGVHVSEAIDLIC